MEKIERIRQLLDSQSTLTLATVGDTGEPRSTPLFYLAGDRLRLYWFSSADSPHSLNCTRLEQTAISIHVPTDEWRKILGLQATGSVAPVGDAEERRAITARYAERFRLGTLFSVALRTSTLYRFSPLWLRLSDNSVRFGYRFELRFPPEPLQK